MNNMNTLSHGIREKFEVKWNEKKIQAGICIYKLQESASFKDLVKCLHPLERKYFSTLKFERKQKSFLLGRISSKLALSLLLNSENLDEICVENGVFNHPVLTIPETSSIQISIAHSGDVAASLAFPSICPMGIDIERIDVKMSGVIESQLTGNEIQVVQNMPFSIEESLTYVWTSKESLSKVLKTGLTSPMTIYEIDKIEYLTNCMLLNYRNFTQYISLSFKFDNYCLSITYPKNVEIKIRDEFYRRIDILS